MVQSLLSEGYFALFLIIAIAYIIGRIKIKGVSLDVSAVIFVALIFGHFGVTLPKIIQDIGLVLFIFTIGIQAGPGFFDALKKHGIKLAVLSTILILTAGLVVIAAHYIFGYDMGILAGLLSGALTSTPGLASATDQFGDISSIGYGIAYPFGVIGVILFLRLLPKILSADISKAEKDWEKESVSEYPTLNYEHIYITNTNVNNKTLSQLCFRKMTDATISRVMHEDEAFIPSPKTMLHTGDLVRVVGTEEALRRARVLLGETTEQEIPLSGKYEVQTVLVTNKSVVNKTLAELNLQTAYDATVTRIRRSGIDITPSPRSRIRFGDKLIIASSKENMKMVLKIFGNDDQKLSDTDILPIALGIVLGVLVGKFTFLGLTGGVLLVALILSKLGKTGPVLWTMSGSANVLLRELGLVFFLAVVGTNAGATLVDTFKEYGYQLFIIGAVITLIPMIVMTVVARLIYKTNVLTLLGALAGAMTSTPGLAAITPMTKSNAPQIAYATAYPIAMVLLVVVVKLLYLL
ncbi:transporter [Paludibacter sp. 221]|uniref:aspartate:alanine exchanger family transporter n=1 Tax=Paludibacter sp. 221 TaxID=2302939 RepID=UPI0013CFC117|nr:transporter [Paludibacter sp. 221]